MVVRELPTEFAIPKLRCDPVSTQEVQQDSKVAVAKLYQKTLLADLAFLAAGPSLPPRFSR